MRIALIDNDHKFREQFQKILQKEMQKIGIRDCHIDCYGSGEEFLYASVQQDSYTLLFTETLLPDMSGIDLARKLIENANSIPTIFVSKVNGFAAETYEVEAEYFLVKPVGIEALYRMFKRLVRQYPVFFCHITFEDGFTCSVCDIVYIKQHRQKTILYLDGESTHISESDIDELYHLLNLHSFYYEVDQGVIVNLRKVKAMNKAVLHLQNGHYITVPRRRMKEIEEAYSDTVLNAK